MNGLDESGGGVITVSASAPGGNHPECGSHESAPPEISKFGHGGTRENSGGKRAGAGRKPKPSPSLPPAIATSKPGLRWFCFQTAPRAELLTLVHLISRGFATFMPLYQPGPGQVLQPLFRGWGFVQFEHQANLWPRINGTPGVRELYSDTPVAQDLMDKLIKLYGPGGSAVYPPGAQKREPIDVGRMVRVVDGSMIDLVGVCQWSDGERIKLLAEMMGGLVSLTVERHQVEEVKA